MSLGQNYEGGTSAMAYRHNILEVSKNEITVEVYKLYGAGKGAENWHVRLSDRDTNSAVGIKIFPREDDALKYVEFLLLHA